MRVAIMALSAVLLWPAAAFATTYLVRPDDAGDFPTIQAAILAAVSRDRIQLGHEGRQPIVGLSPGYWLAAYACRWGDGALAREAM
jgi:hypothetical protein